MMNLLIYLKIYADFIKKDRKFRSFFMNNSIEIKSNVHNRNPDGEANPHF